MAETVEEVCFLFDPILIIQGVSKKGLHLENTR